MAEYTERDKLLYEFREIMPDIGVNELADKLYNVALDLPAADVAEVRCGRWEEVDWVEPDGHGFGTVRTPKAGLRCNQCSNVFKKELLWKRNYCPNCGAKMTED